MTKTCACSLVVVALVSTFAVPSGASPEAQGPVLFVISKSENRNQVVYAIHVDEQCRPAGNAPVYAYWRMLENGPQRVESLLWREQPAYGLASQEVAPAGDDGVVRIRLRAMPDRAIEVRTALHGAECRTSATTTVGDTQATLYNVHVQLRWPFGVESITVTGLAQAGGQVVREILKR